MVPRSAPVWPTIETIVAGEAVDRVDTCFGMRKVEVVNGKTLLNNHALYQKLILYQGCCCTRLTDVFQEVNGLTDMDRTPKANMDEIRRINEQR